MSTKYWDLYVLYLKNREKENYINDIDPNHYRMEWNHFWPQCIFGDWPVGQFLTLRQHAIASALQTLVFKKNCMCGWHKGYLPPNLLELAWSYYCEASSERMKETMHAEKDENGKSLQAVRNSEKLNAKKDENGKSLNAVKGGKDSKSSAVTNSQLWQSTVDGFTGNPGNVAQYNRARGWPGDARVRIS
jgi:hypothetical protein